MARENSWNGEKDTQFTSLACALALDLSRAPAGAITDEEGEEPGGEESEAEAETTAWRASHRQSFASSPTLAKIARWKQFQSTSSTPLLCPLKMDTGCRSVCGRPTLKRQMVLSEEAESSWCSSQGEKDSP